MPSKGDLQTTWNLIEAINDAYPDAKAFRTHCTHIFEKVGELNRAITPSRNAPDFAASEAARDAIEPLNAALEECLGLLRKCASIGVLEKMFDKGETKGNLETATRRLDASFHQFSLWLNGTRSAPSSKTDTTVAPNASEVSRAAPFEDRTPATANFPGAQIATPASQVEKRPSPSQVYPDLL